MKSKILIDHPRQGCVEDVAQVTGDVRALSEVTLVLEAYGKAHGAVGGKRTSPLIRGVREADLSSAL